MIELVNVCKSYGDVLALKNINMTIKDGLVMGLLGTNGAGKSTMLRMMSGILKADYGEIMIDGKKVWNNPEVKAKFFYISDEQYYFPNATAKEFGEFYSTYYPDFDTENFRQLLEKIDLPSERKIKTFSKGMKKQLSILIGICTKTPYLFCDETFDGLDPVMRQAIKSLFVHEMSVRTFTPIIASHNLRELEDICDHIGLLHKGGVLFSHDLEVLRGNLTKVQCVLSGESDDFIRNTLDVLKMNRNGKLLTFTARGDSESVLAILHTLNPIYCEAIPLTLE